MPEFSDVNQSAPQPRYTALWVNHFAAPPDEAGGTRHFEIARALVHRNVRVRIAASDFLLLGRRYARRIDQEDQSLIVEKIDDVEFHWLWTPPYGTSNVKRAINWLTFAKRALRAEMAPQRPDVIIGSSPHLFAAMAAARLAHNLSVPFVFEVRDLWPESLVAVTGRRSVGYYLLRIIARYLYRRADRIIVLARGTATYLERIGVSPQRLCYVPNGVDIDAFPPIERAPRSMFTAVYAGAHGPANGLDVVLEAACLLQGRQDIRIVLVGDGPTKSLLQEYAARHNLTNVEFRPPVAKQCIPALLAEADVGLMVLKNASLFGFAVSPNKLFDYLAAALPVVCNVAGDLESMLCEAGAGVQATDASASALAEALVRVANMPYQERIAMGSSGRAWVASEHSRGVLAERLDVILSSLIVA